MFMVASRAITDVEPHERFTSDAELTLGCAARLNGGKLALATGADMPTHVVMGEKDAQGAYPAIRVLPTTVFETTCETAVAQSKLGAALTLGADGLTATGTDGGHFVLTETEEKDGGHLRGYFA